MALSHFNAALLFSIFTSVVFGITVRDKPRDQVRYAKPDPDLFLTAAEHIGVEIADSMVVGDSVWDLLAAQRARALGIGLLSGGYGREELIYAGAFRVYEDPLDLLAHLDEVGVRRPV